MKKITYTANTLLCIITMICISCSKDSGGGTVQAQVVRQPYPMYLQSSILLLPYQVMEPTLQLSVMAYLIIRVYILQQVIHVTRHIMEPILLSQKIQTVLEPRVILSRSLCHLQ
jgi:hypothetical protein